MAGAVSDSEKSLGILNWCWISEGPPDFPMDGMVVGVIAQSRCGKGTWEDSVRVHHRPPHERTLVRVWGGGSLANQAALRSVEQVGQRVVGWRLPGSIGHEE